jgi:hypothetical protein
VSISDGLPNTGISSIVLDKTDLFIGVWGNGIWRRPLSEMIPSSSVAQSEQPVTFTLNQNYPNPFNPSTEISYTLTERDMVQLDVFDVLGRRVETLVHAQMYAGPHTARFDGTGLASGIYTARLMANGARREMKMLLTK